MFLIDPPPVQAQAPSGPPATLPTARIPSAHGNRQASWRCSLHAQAERPITLPIVRWLMRPIPHPEINLLRRIR